MGKNIFHAGAAGARQTAKICNNMLLGILMAGTAETLALGVANGLDPKVLVRHREQELGPQLGRWSCITPGVMDNTPPAIGYSGGFGSDLMLKDLGLAQAACTPRRHPLGAAARNLYQLHSQNGQGGWIFPASLQLMSARPSRTGLSRYCIFPVTAFAWHKAHAGLPRATDGIWAGG